MEFPIVDKLDIGRAILLDEGENADLSSPLRRVFNSGHKSNGRRTIKKRTYSTYAPVVLAMISERELHQSMLRRSHVVELQRTRRDLQLKRVEMHNEDLNVIHDHIVDFMQGRAIDRNPDLPDGLRNGAVSARDNWRPLIAVCDAVDAANHEINPLKPTWWGKRAREVALRMSKRVTRHDLKVVLLYDIRAIFDDSGEDKILDRDLVAALNHRDNGVWVERLGAGFTRSKLKQMLSGFRKDDGSPVEPSGIRLRPGAASRRGYARKWFENAFARYLDDVKIENEAGDDDDDDRGPQLRVVRKE
jgi:hypothetical protein